MATDRAYTVYSSIGQDINSPACPVSDVLSKCKKKTSNGHNSATRHPIDFVLGGWVLFGLT